MYAKSFLRQLPTVHRTAVRSTWVLRRVAVPSSTLPDAVQRDPSELPETQRLEVVDFETKRAAGPLKVILLRDIEGIGHQFDVVDVDRKLARTDLLPSRKAVYASPFDLRYYSEMKERMKDELAARVRVPYEFVVVGRQLQRMIVPIKVSMENAWTVNTGVLKASLRQMGVDVLDDAIYFASDSVLSGPNFEIEAKLVRFYIVVGNQYIVPMLGRISHISADEAKQVISPEQTRFPSDTELAKYGMRPEEPYYHKAADLTPDFDVVAFMKKRK